MSFFSDGFKEIKKASEPLYRTPKSIQETIEILKVAENGIFEVSKNHYSKCYLFQDINYTTTNEDEQIDLFERYCKFLNSLDVSFKITINNKNKNMQRLREHVYLKSQDDGFDPYRKIYNDIIESKIQEGRQGIEQERYLTITIERKNFEEAKAQFATLEAIIHKAFGELGAEIVPINGDERIRTLFDFYHLGEEERFSFQIKEARKVGADFRNDLCNGFLQFYPSYFKDEKKFCRALFIKKYPSSLSDRFLNEITSLPVHSITSIDVVPVPKDFTTKILQKKYLGIESDIIKQQRVRNKNNDFSSEISYNKRIEKKEIETIMDDVRENDQCLFFVAVTIILMGETKEELESITETVETIGKRNSCTIEVHYLKQREALNTALPIGVRQVETMRSMLTQSLAVLMPFNVQELSDKDGIYYGINQVSKNIIVGNRKRLINGNGFVFGVPGSGKSFNAKMQIVFLALATQDDILICDPEREYASLVEAMGGEVVRIAAGSRDHINAMDMVDGYGDGGDPVIEKSQFILSLFEQLDKKGINAKERSIIDRCVGEVYEEYQHGGAVPTLRVLREKFLEQEEPEAQDLALVSELFTNGSLDAFAHESNVDVNNRIMVYDILDLGKQLKTMGLLVITDAMLNRVTENWKQGKRTHIFLDEFHVVFENEYSGAFFNSAWRRFRKRNAFPTAITQNVEYLLDSVLASTMISNSEYIVMLNQAEPDRAKLATLLNISTEQMGYITNADAGCGLVKYGSSLVPFVNRFPTNTRLYKLMTTKPGEDSINRGRM